MALLATSLFLSLASAQGTIDLFRNATTDSDFESFISSCNASTVLDIEIPNIHNETYPSKDDSVTWKAWLTVNGKSDDRAEAIDAGFWPGEDYVNSNHTIENDESWKICVDLTRFRKPGLSLSEPIHSNCSNVFPEDCLNYINNYAKEGKMCVNSRIAFYKPWEETPCEGVLTDETTPFIFQPSDIFHPANINNLTYFPRPLREDKPAEDKYDFYLDSVYMLTLGFGRANDSDNGDTGSGLDQKAPSVESRFVCMRPDEFKAGSRTLQDVEDLGVGMSAPVGWAVLAGATAMMLSVF